MKHFLSGKSRRATISIRMLADRVLGSGREVLKKTSHLFIDKYGIEIGGPSYFFTSKGLIPLYAIAKCIDGCNFSAQTAWEGNIVEGETYSYFPGKMGYQYICEGAEVVNIPKAKYDFVLSCNNLEHIANPLKALKNWLNLIKDNGAIVLVLPRKESNFDHRRQVTSFEHLLEDYNSNIAEDDLTHLPEILQFHDLRYDPLAEGFDNFKNRSYHNFKNRCLHHHVYDLNLLEQICNYFNLNLVAKKSLTADHIIVATKQ